MIRPCLLLALSVLLASALRGDASGAGSVPTTAEKPVLNVMAFGVVGDGTTLNTAAIQQAIDTCSGSGGGTLTFPAGRYLTGTVRLKDGVTLHLEEQAVLLGSTRAADYLNPDPFMAGDGVPLGHALIVALDARHVGLEGKGRIEGQGRALKAAQTPYVVRPFLIRWVRCTDVTVKDLHLADPGAWTLNFFQSRDATVERVTIRTRDSGLVNNDGIDLDSCERIRIRDCDIESGDDALCLKATSSLPCRDITASGCTLSTHCNAIKLGTESLGDFERIRVEDCRLRAIGMAGIALYAVDGGHLHDVVVSDITMDGVAVPVSVRLGARLKTFRAGDQAKPPGTLRDVTIRNVRATGARQIGILVNGIPGHPVENLTLDNLTLEMSGGGTEADAAVQLPENEAAYPECSMFGRVLPAHGLYLRHVAGVTLRDVRTSVARPDARPAHVFIDVEGITPASFIADSSNSAASTAVSPDQGLGRHPFLYAGEWDHRKPDQPLFLVRDGKVAWSYSIPIKDAAGTLQEWGDATLLSNGNVLFARKTGAGLVTPEKKLLWNYDAPPGTEIHVVQPLGLDRVLLVQNGSPAKLFIIEIATGKVVKELALPTPHPGKPHLQFRRVRLTRAGTFLAAHLDADKVVEYDRDGHELWSFATPGPWTAVRLKNGNTLITSYPSSLLEVNPKGEVVWSFDQKDASGIRFFIFQEASRLANGNTLVSNWCPVHLKNPADWPSSVQVLEITPDKKIVWALRSWDEPADLGPASAVQLLDEPGVPEAGDLQR